MITDRLVNCLVERGKPDNNNTGTSLERYICFIQVVGGRAFSVLETFFFGAKNSPHLGKLQNVLYPQTVELFVGIVWLIPNKADPSSLLTGFV